MMKYSKLAAFAAALAIIGGQSLPQTVMSPAAVYAADTEQLAGEVTLRVGESVVPEQTSGTETPAWTSDDPKIATVSASGKITGVSAGTTYINAIFSSGIQRFKVTVTEKENGSEEQETVTDLGTVELDNDHAAVSAKLNNAPEGEQVWSSSDTSVAVVDQEGNITAVGEGECTIKAVIGKNSYVLKVISKYQPELIQPEKKRYDLGSVELDDVSPSKVMELGLPEGTAITWKSSDEKVATVTADGKLYAHSSGNCTVTGETAEAVYTLKVTSKYTGSSEVTEKVIGDVKLTQSIPDKKLNLTSDELSRIKWSTTDDKVAVPDGNGMINAVGAGKCDIRLEKDGILYIVHVESEFRPASELSEKDCEGQIIGIGNNMSLSGGSGEVLKWESLNEDVAVVDENGVVTSKSEGIAVIKAHYADYSSAIAVNVKVLALSGDADCDGKVKMNDAVLIMQSISNPDRFTLEGKGRENADCYGDNDGITPNDALAIQKYLLNLYTSLPVKDKQ
ncbi:MAG TPA: Ig-like domain-containing protein [Ruminococcus sp.]|nr:Ig-like domain-containing protein [Ruminococcus sp.]